MLTYGVLADPVTYLTLDGNKYSPMLEYEKHAILDGNNLILEDKKYPILDGNKYIPKLEDKKHPILDANNSI